MPRDVYDIGNLFVTYILDSAAANIV